MDIEILWLLTGHLVQEILAKIRTSLADFDAVCMATALHTMASLKGLPAQYDSLKSSAEMQSLMQAIGELHVP